MRLKIGEVLEAELLRKRQCTKSDSSNMH